MNSSSPPAAGWLRCEGLAVLAASLLLYGRFGRGWLLLALLLMLPDLSMLGYAAGARAGALAYNLAHSYAGPLLLGAGAAALGAGGLASLALIWTAHIGLDRALGYGLKLPTGFQDTHLGRIGRPEPASKP